MNVAAWLHGLGLGQYEQAFRENDIDAAVLASLTAEDLIGIGVGSSATAANCLPRSRSCVTERRRRLLLSRAHRPRYQGWFRRCRRLSGGR